MDILSNSPSKHNSSNLMLSKFVDMATRLTGSQLHDVIIQTLEASGLYVFAELLDIPSIQQMKNNSDIDYKYWKLINIFAYGTLQTYINSQDELPPLSERMIKKLQLLTLTSLASNAKFLLYSELRRELHIENIRELEDLLILAIYEEAIKGRLDQLNSRLEIDWCTGRDVKNEDMQHIITTLSSWCSGGEAMLSTIEIQSDLSDKFVCHKLLNKEKLSSQINNLRSTSQSSIISRNLQESSSGSSIASANVVESKSKKSNSKQLKSPALKAWSTKN